MVAEAYSLDCHKGMLPIEGYYSPQHFPLFNPKGGMGEEKGKKKNRWWDPPHFLPLSFSPCPGSQPHTFPHLLSL